MVRAEIVIHQFQRRVRLRLRQLEMNQKDLAAQLGVHKGTLSHWISCARMTEATLLRITRALRMELEDWQTPLGVSVPNPRELVARRLRETRLAVRAKIAAEKETALRRRRKAK